MSGSDLPFFVNKILTQTQSSVYFLSPSSLSLEYHPKLLNGLPDISPDNMPKVQYLQCPAGVRIHHLQKFLYSKFSINPLDHKVDLIYEDNIVQSNVTLMDLVYICKWKRVSV